MTTMLRVGFSELSLIFNHYSSDLIHNLLAHKYQPKGIEVLSGWKNASKILII